MKKRTNLLIVGLLILAILVPLPETGIIYSQSQGQAEDASKPSVRRSTGWFRRPAGAGDYQEAVDLPNMERP